MIEAFIQLSLPTQLAMIYALVINIITFFYFGIDKIKSRGDTRRVPEKTLWLLSLVGGSVGGLCAMYFFRHKTKKISFQCTLAVVVLVQLAAIYIVIRYL
ncbi:MAG: DUF1294 domain-containing protein [Candidatus Magasanikbacteria bacterium CG10_big_fil_rev_8_21_14_0_10_43_6]|uniref:DUF1294 domain-containing protein n=1 Tax=Candidatus Magasanikbacteria bacterium CG10_big_fil_rev_8_21_14_0_10_43_6 TaxID=1974650 RepID=A0A2M6W0B6_9BACT|nr:MAG: DUF1294 domain-containing protein [Candidatus Magasanikbacteria bacterium CG10_big_fil_rev_8_21_14_0_10_43_6]